MSKLDSLLVVREELLKRVNNYEKYKDIYLLETLKNQLVQNDKLIKKELNDMKSVAIISREDIVIGFEDRLVRTNIDNKIPLAKCIQSGDYDILTLDDRMNLHIKSGITNQVYVSFDERVIIDKGKELGYLVPCKEMKKSGVKER